MTIQNVQSQMASSEAGDTPLVALAICAAMYAAFWLGHDTLVAFIRPFLEAVPKPADAPDVWWGVAQRFTRSGPAEVAVVFALVWLYARVRGLSFADFGFNRPGTLLAWGSVLAVQGLLFVSEMRGPIGTVGNRFDFYPLYASLMIAVTASFSEELFFRGFLIETLRRGGFSNALQVGISALLFGGIHLTYIPRDIYGWTIPVGTAIIGVFWGYVYIWGKRSLWPTLAAHFINDFVVLPAAFYLFATNPPG